MFEQITAPQILVIGERHFDGSHFSMGWSYITEPFLMVDEAHFHDYEQYIGFIGGDLTDMKDFNAEIELYFGDEGTRQVIDTTSIIYVPKGLVHGPLNITRVTKPFLFIDIVLGPKPDYRRKPVNPSI